MAGVVAAAAITAGTQLIGAFIAGSNARKARKAANRQEQRIKELEANRQKIIDPSTQIEDLSGMVSNPFANLQVATGAAEFAAEQQDLSLASTLDTLRATGAGAGGATALAQAATRGRQQIAADIQRQEAANARLRAQGEQRAQALRMQEAQRVQSAKAQAQQFMFGAQETREMQALDRAAGLQAQARQQQMAGQAGVASSLGSAAGTFAQFGAENPESLQNLFSNRNNSVVGDYMV